MSQETIIISSDEEGISISSEEVVKMMAEPINPIQPESED